MNNSDDLTRRGRRTALFIAAIGVYWICVTALGSALGWSQQLRLLFDLLALVWFGLAIWMIYGLWRDRQKHKD
jgi:hypothetical protein